MKNKKLNITIKKEKLFEIAVNENREIAKEQGFYDGRFRSRVIPDKKKLNQIKSCRRFRKNSRNISINEL